MVVGRQQKCGRVTTSFATCRTRYVLVHNKFATYYFLYTTEYIPLVSVGYPEPLSVLMGVYVVLLLLVINCLLFHKKNEYKNP